MDLSNYSLKEIILSGFKSEVNSRDIYSQIADQVSNAMLKNRFKFLSSEEEKHAEEIAERLVYLGGKPTTKPDPIFVGKNLKEMIKQDNKDEETAIELYKKIIKLANEEGDTTTARLFRKILMEEKDYHDTFSGLLE